MTNKACPEKTGFIVTLYSYARSHPKSSGDGGEHGDDDVQDFAPKGLVVVFHDCLMFD